MSVKESLLNWLKASAKSKHRAAPEVVEEKKEATKKSPSKEKKGEVRRDQ
ncbi:MAG: hypothetical protein AB7F31_04490 [Parachlamydiales bacterium]